MHVQPHLCTKFRRRCFIVNKRQSCARRSFTYKPRLGHQPAAIICCLGHAARLLIQINNPTKNIYIYIYIKEESHYSILQIFDMFMAKKPIQKPGAYEL